MITKSSPAGGVKVRLPSAFSVTSKTVSPTVIFPPSMVSADVKVIFPLSLLVPPSARSASEVDKLVSVFTGLFSMIGTSFVPVMVTDTSCSE